MSAMFIYSMVQIITGAFTYKADEWRVFHTALVMVGSVVMLITSWALPIGETGITEHLATNTKVENELIIQSNGIPTQITTDIKFVDQPVKVVKIIPTNVWGIKLDGIIQYNVELVD